MSLFIWKPPVLFVHLINFLFLSSQVCVDHYVFPWLIICKYRFKSDQYLYSFREASIESGWSWIKYILSAGLIKNLNSSWECDFQKIFGIFSGALNNGNMAKKLDFNLFNILNRSNPIIAQNRSLQIQSTHSLYVSIMTVMFFYWFLVQHATEGSRLIRVFTYRYL